MHGKQEHALAGCGLWLLIGFVGATAVAAGLLQLLEGEAPPFAALTLLFSGAALAAMSWRRGRIVLEDAERPRGRVDNQISRVTLPLHRATRRVRSRV